MNVKLKEISKKATMRVMQSVHWLYLRQKQATWKDYLEKVRFALPGILCLLSIIVISSVIYCMRSKVYHAPEFAINPSNLVIRQLPKELSEYVKEIIPVGLPERLSVFQNNLPQLVTTSYYQNPWVKKVVEVRKAYPNRIAVQLTLRQPLFFIEKQGKYFLMSEDGVRLPGEYDAPPHNRLWIISGVNDLPQIGKSWKDPSIIEIVNIALMWRNCKIQPVIPVEKVYLKTDDTLNSLIVLETAQQTQIVWGRKFQSILPGVSAEKRITSLVKLTHKYSLLQELEAVDIRFGCAIVKEKGLLTWKQNHARRRR